MRVRVGVDVGGTFTKAVAVDVRTGELVAQALVPTSHGHEDGVSAGVVEVVHEIATRVGPEAVEMVTHSTTQAVNALLEGDLAPVGIVRLGRGHGFRKAPARTLYSGPAASVAGALRTGRIDDGIIVEVGGTSTNVAAIKHGKPALSYVQVASHATAIRALDVRVMGV